MYPSTERAFCAACGLKHLSQAWILYQESITGYPHHYWPSMGHMAEAEDEIALRMPQEAGEIRAARKAWEADRTRVPGFLGLLYRVAVTGSLVSEEDVPKGVVR